jgi:uncharacterized protein YjbI with pentapeptide repeats
LANPKHLAKRKEGVVPWNRWRKRNPKIAPDLGKANLRQAILRGANLSEASLSGAKLPSADLREANLRNASLHSADLKGAKLSGADLAEANLNLVKAEGADLSGAYLAKASLHGADLRGADLHGAELYLAEPRCADLRGADLSGAKLSEANLMMAKLSGANLVGSNLFMANLGGADLSGADLSGSDLKLANLVEANLDGADLTGCSVYGISAWDVKLEGATQSNLVVTRENEPPIQVDNLEVAHFIYLLLNNQKIRSVIDTITSKVVLILGRFTKDRLAVLEAIRVELRKRDYLPVLFDFEKPTSRTTVETISTLAHMARFVIADLTDAKSVLQELQAVVPLSPSVVVQPLLLAAQEEPGMFDFIRKFPWVLDTHRYTDQTTLLSELKEEVIDPAEAKSKELARKK